jgi:hypothetical protein
MDSRLETGMLWDSEIRKRIAASDVALTLVSQAFLDSAYCRNVEVANFLDRRAREGLVIYPVILSPCSWDREGWLRTTQVQPREGCTLEEHYQSSGPRKRLFLTIRNELSTIAERKQRG